MRPKSELLSPYAAHGIRRVDRFLWRSGGNRGELYESKGNVIPGVAIATALMPPLCTAGFGLASGNLYYFFGAFYLYFINTVFISWLLMWWYVY